MKLLIAFIACVVLMAGPRTASASDCAPPVVPLAAARFTAHVIEDGLAWDARYVVEVDAAFSFQGGSIPFATPLPVGETMRPALGLTPILDRDQRIVGICAKPETMRDRTITAAFIQPLPALSSSSHPIGAPIAAGRFVQIIDSSLSTSSDRRLELAGGHIERNLGYLSPRGLGHEAREEARRLTDTPVSVTSSPVFLRGDDARAEPIMARIREPPSRARSATIGVAILFVLVASALVLAARKLQDSASVERADAFLVHEIERSFRGPAVNGRPSRSRR